MPRRVMPLVSGEIYHLFNRSVARQPIFNKSNDYLRFLETTDFYRFDKPGMRFSHFNRLPLEQKTSFLNALYESGEKIVDILSFSFMPNHYHFLIQQLKEKGITTFAGNLQNSFAKYFNTKYDRSGSLFQEMFKVKRIETDEQLIHVARYIHLNPVTSYIIKEIADLETYPWTSFIDYMGNRNITFLSKSIIQEFFPKSQKLKEFTYDQADYQRDLDTIKHLILE